MHVNLVSLKFPAQANILGWQKWNELNFDTFIKEHSAAVVVLASQYTQQCSDILKHFHMSGFNMKSHSTEF